MFSRVVRRGGKAVRQHVTAGPLADSLHARVAQLKAEAAARAAVIQDLLATLEPVRATYRAYLAAVRDLHAAFLHTIGYHREHQTWRRYVMTVEQFTKLDGVHPAEVGDVDAVTDLGRTARDALVALIAGPDADRAAGVRADLAAKRTAWLEPNDPPAVVMLADALAVAWLQWQYFDLQHARHAAAGVDPAVVRVWFDRSDEARTRVAELRRDLQDTRKATADHAARLLALDALRRQARRRTRAAAKRSRTGTRG